jgi:hypothetical protein
MTKRPYEEIISLRASGHVRRWHTMHALLDQDVAAHCAQALSLLLMLHPNPSIRLIKAVLWHDSGERVTGDGPSTGKIRFPALKAAFTNAEMTVAAEDHHAFGTAMAALTNEDLSWLRAVDLIELAMHCGDELMVGNQHFRPVMLRATQMIRSVSNSGQMPSEAIEFFEWYVQHGQRSLA